MTSSRQSVLAFDCTAPELEPPPAPFPLHAPTVAGIARRSAARAPTEPRASRPPERTDMRHLRLHLLDGRAADSTVDRGPGQCIIRGSAFSFVEKEDMRTAF